MTIPVIKIKVTKKSIVKGKMDVRFPPNVTAAGGIILNKDSSGYHFTFDASGIVLAPPSASGSLGAVTAFTPVAHNFLIGVDTNGNHSSARPDASDSTYTSSAPNTVATTANAKLDRVYHVSDWGVKGDGTDETTKLQAALNNCPLGATLEGYPDKPIIVSANGSQCLFMTRMVNLHNIWIGMLNTLSTSVDVLAIKPATGNWYNFRMSGCIIGNSSLARYGRHAIRIYSDNTTPTMISSVFEKLFIGQGAATVGNAFYHDNTGGLEPNGGLRSSVIKDSVLCNGVRFIQTGDRNTIENCEMLGSTTSGALVDLDFISGAMNFNFVRNNCGQVSLYFRSGLYPKIFHNTFEQTIIGYQPNNALVDFDGGTTQIDGPVVESNIFQMLNGVSPSNCIRFNNVKNAMVKGGNRLSMATATVPLVATVTSIGTHVSRNQEAFTNGASWATGITNIPSHDKPIVQRLVSDANTTIDADGGGTYATGIDHTICNSGSLTANRTWTLPPLSHCFPGEEFVIHDIANAIGAFKITLARNGSTTDVFFNGATTFDLVSPGARAVLKANPSLGIWHLQMGSAVSLDTDGTLAANSDLRFSSQKATKTYVDALSSSTTSSLATKLDKTAQHSIFCGNSQANNIVGGETRFMVFHPFDTTETTVYVPIPIAGTFSNLVIYSNGSPGASQTYTATLRKALADTALTCQIPAGTNTASDNTHTVHFNAGDRMALKVVSSATAATTPISWAAVFTPD